MYNRYMMRFLQGARMHKLRGSHLNFCLTETRSLPAFPKGLQTDAPLTTPPVEASGLAPIF